VLLAPRNELVLSRRGRFGYSKAGGDRHAPSAESVKKSASSFEWETVGPFSSERRAVVPLKNLSPQGDISQARRNYYKAVPLAGRWGQWPPPEGEGSCLKEGLLIRKGASLRGRVFPVVALPQMFPE